jgi:type II secretory pathway pseudopilin PulG
MATLLVALAVMSVLMSAVLPAWRHQARREKEEELVFRGEQYVRAIQLWERKMGPGSRPPSIEMLVDQRFLRKKYKDPMVEDGEFQLLFLGALDSAPGRGGAAQDGRGRVAGSGRISVSIGSGRGGATGASGQVIFGGGPGGRGGGGIMGVTSKSKEASIRNYKGATHYNEWRFVHAGAAIQPGGGDGRPVPGGGRRGVGPGGRGGFPGPGRGGRGGIGPGGMGPGGGPQPVRPFPGRGRGQ